MQGTVEVRPDEMDSGLDDSLQEPQEPSVGAQPDQGESDEVEIVVEGKEGAAPPDRPGEPPARSLDDENRELKKQLLEIGRSLQELRTQKEPLATQPPSVEPPASTSLEQVAGLIKEYGHDPEAMARIIDHVTEQKARQVAMTIRDETMKDVNYQQWFTEQKKLSDKIVGPLYETSPEKREAVMVAVKNLGFEGHPLGELAVVAMLEMAKAEKTREVVETTRTKELTEKKSLDKTRGAGSGKKPGLTQSQLDVAQKLGLDPKTYARYLGIDAGTQREGRI
jgi:hypothetical protein